LPDKDFEFIESQVGFVNGLPQVVIELKKPGVPARAALDKDLMSYKLRFDTSPRHSVFSPTTLTRPPATQ